MIQKTLYYLKKKVPCHENRWKNALFIANYVILLLKKKNYFLDKTKHTCLMILNDEISYITKFKIHESSIHPQTLREWLWSNIIPSITSPHTFANNTLASLLILRGALWLIGPMAPIISKLIEMREALTHNIEKSLNCRAVMNSIFHLNLSKLSTKAKR
jgi:hypothetical protein